MVKVESYGDLLINGMGSSGGGSFKKVIINGKGTVHGDVECESFQLSGSGTVNGSMKGNKGRISGTGTIEGDIEFDTFSIEGSGGIQKDATIKSMTISGKGSIGGSLKGDEVKIRGKAAIKGDCESDVFKGEGGFTVGGLLNADLIDITIIGECSAKEIGGQTIKVKQKPFGIMNLLKSVYPTSLTTEIIEGDEIEIENTNAKMVRGTNIIVGPNCTIDVVEYKGTYTQHPSAKVRESRKL
ncbi:polymer-forming cytoskeletal protein [Fredinandcohnia humi]